MRDEDRVMRGFLLRLLISALGLAVAAALLPGITIEDAPTLFLAALLLGLLNALVRPIVLLLTLPLTILTLGLFLLVVNGLMLALVAALLDGFHVAGFGSAVLGSILVSLTSGFASWMIGGSGRIEVMVIRG
jgi:putative membrane protein